MLDKVMLFAIEVRVAVLLSITALLLTFGAIAVDKNRIEAIEQDYYKIVESVTEVDGEFVSSAKAFRIIQDAYYFIHSVSIENLSGTSVITIYDDTMDNLRSLLKNPAKLYRLEVIKAINSDVYHFRLKEVN